MVLVQHLSVCLLSILMSDDYRNTRLDRFSSHWETTYLVKRYLGITEKCMCKDFLISLPIRNDGRLVSFSGINQRLLIQLDCQFDGMILGTFV